jgi:hypothetical protein
MNTLTAYLKNQASTNRDLYVFDWDRAARRIVETQAVEASAGLAEDWEWTGGSIFRNGKPCFEDYTYLASTHAIPELGLDGELEDCYVRHSERPEWDSGTKWPESALQILREAGINVSRPDAVVSEC